MHLNPALFMPLLLLVVGRPSEIAGVAGMTGGGAIGDATVEADLPCDAAQSGRFTITSPGGRFELEALTFVACGGDIVVAEGAGRWNGEPGHDTQVWLADAGEPATYDAVEVQVTDPSGAAVFETFGRLVTGNLDWHD